MKWADVSAVKYRCRPILLHRNLLPRPAFNQIGESLNRQCAPMNANKKQKGLCLCLAGENLSPIRVNSRLFAVSSGVPEGRRHPLVSLRLTTSLNRYRLAEPCDMFTVSRQ